MNKKREERTLKKLIKETKELKKLEEEEFEERKGEEKELFLFLVAHLWHLFFYNKRDNGGYRL